MLSLIIETEVSVLVFLLAEVSILRQRIQNGMD